jgi:EmrB/QacA subfamily drug resistance transporter
VTSAPGAVRPEGLLSALMLGVASGAILVPLNSTMLAVALPGIMDEFALGANEVSSLVSLYLGAVAVALPVAGSLTDRFGARRVFIVGVVAFAAASLVAAVGTSFLVLEGARVLQAASGALVSTSSAALIRETAPAARRGEAFGLFDLLVSTSAAVGPFVGGILVAALGWRSMFTVAVPIALVAAAAVTFLLREPADARPARPPHPIDVWGLALLALLIVALLVGLRNLGTGLGLAALAAAAPLGALFVAVELRTARPAVDPRLFRRPPFASAVAGVFGATVVLHGCFFLVPILVERLQGGSPTASGLVLLGIAGVSAVVAPWGGRRSDRLGRRGLVVGGSLVMAAGLGALALPVGIASAASVGVLLGVVGLGLGLAGSPRQAAAFETVEADRVGMAAGTYFTGRYLGGVVGASLGGAVLASGVTSGGIGLGFGLLAVVSLAVAVASVGLPARPGSGAAEPARV